MWTKIIFIKVLTCFDQNGHRQEFLPWTQTAAFVNIMQSFFLIGVRDDLLYIMWCCGTKQTNIFKYGSQKHNYIYVTYKLLVYTQTSQPTICFGLFHLDHLQFGHNGHRKYTIMQYYHVRGEEISFTKNGACVQTGIIEIYALLSVVCGNTYPLLVGSWGDSGFLLRYWINI